MNDYCFVVVTDKSWYEDFFPFFCFFANRAYPYVDILLYVKGGNVNKNMVKKLRQLGIPDDKYKIIEKYKKEYPSSLLFPKLTRWVINDENIRKYKYAYIGDIDILICKESKNLFESHIKHMNLIDLPYSNIIRPKGKRLTGLHFIKVEDYLLLMQDQINLIDRKIKNDPKNKLFRKRNEEILFIMVKNAGLINNKIKQSRIKNPYSSNYFDFGFRPHHGIHLGFFRETRTDERCLKNKHMIPYFEDFLKGIEDKRVEIALLSSNKEILNLFNKCKKIATLYRKDCL